MKKISNQFVVNTVEDGESAPYYFQEWYAWSNDVSTASVTTEPTIDGVWATSIPAQGSYAYLWRKSIRNVWDANSRTYTQEAAQYFRMSGTNGTTISVKGSVDYAYNNTSDFPPASSALSGKTAVAKTQGNKYRCVFIRKDYYWVYDTVTDGDSYTVVQGSFEEDSDYQSASQPLSNHLIQWSNEGQQWLDLGLFKGEAGVTYYTHIAWATEVTLESSALPIPAGQTNRPNALAANISGFSITPLSGVSYAWMGYLIDTNSSDSQTKQNYTWQMNKGEKGDDASEVNPNILLRTIFDDGINKVKEAWSSNWSGISIDTATDTIVEGRKSIRINAGMLSTNEFIDFGQNLYGKLKPSTWYTLSFNYFSTHNFSTFLWGGDNTPLVIDRSAGFYKDGTFIAEPPIDGNVRWGDDWTGARHTLTFKTIDTFPSEYFWIMFRTYHIDGTTDRAQLALCMPKLEIGEVATAYMANEDDLRGEKGDKGNIGRFFYFGGVFNAADNDTTHTFIVNDAQAPYFEHTENGQKRYHVFNYDANGTYTMAQMWAVSDNWNNKPWEAMTNDFKYLITEAIFAGSAHFGSAIISGDWMLSQHGTKNGEASTSYTDFDPAHPNDNTGTNFIPNYCVDLLTGTVYQQNAFVKGTIEATSGSFAGQLKGVNGTFTHLKAAGDKVEITTTPSGWGGYDWYGFSTTTNGTYNGDLATIGARITNTYDYGRLVLVKRNKQGTQQQIIILDAGDGTITAPIMKPTILAPTGFVAIVHEDDGPYSLPANPLNGQMIFLHGSTANAQVYANGHAIGHGAAGGNVVGPTGTWTIGLHNAMLVYTSVYDKWLNLYSA